MKAKFFQLESADHSLWRDVTSHMDRLPIRDSGPWIKQKHNLLTYYAKMFATGMKNKWANRVYLELFSGPGKCLVRGTSKEEDGSPLKVIGHEFTQFIFTEMSLPAAQALQQRLELFDNANRAEIWCGDCAEAIRHIQIPADALTFAFIDPTGIEHAPFSLIKTLCEKARCDLLINVAHGMGIRMNMHQYTPNVDETSALTKFLGHERWKSLSQNNATEFFRGVLDLYKQQLEKLDFRFIGREVLVRNERGTGLYLLLFASKHPRGREFWEKAIRGVEHPELDFGS